MKEAAVAISNFGAADSQLRCENLLPRHLVVVHSTNPTSIGVEARRKPKKATFETKPFKVTVLPHRGSVLGVSRDQNLTSLEWPSQIQT